MRSFLRSTSASLGLVLIGCTSAVGVKTMAAPDENLATLRTFRVMNAPTRPNGLAMPGADDPMVSNSIANKTLRAQIIKSLESRGYVQSDQNPDFSVAFYATSKDKLDVTSWDYGYPYYPTWRRFGRTDQTITQYTEGSVIIDAVRPGSRDLIWRGEGKATLSNDPSDNVDRLAKAADAIIAKFPRPNRPVVATSRQ